MTNIFQLPTKNEKPLSFNIYGISYSSILLLCLESLSYFTGYKLLVSSVQNQLIFSFLTTAINVNDIFYHKFSARIC